MMKDQVRLNVTCPSCGHKSETYKQSNGDKPDSVAHCMRCDAEFGLVSDLKKAAFKHAEQEMKKALKSFKLR